GKRSGNSQFVIRNSELLDGHYVVTPDHRVHFEVPDYDKSRRLVIDPVLVYSTYLGGSGDDYAGGIAVDSLRKAYVAGATSSTNFPTLIASQATNGGR